MLITCINNLKYKKQDSHTDHYSYIFPDNPAIDYDGI